MSRRPVLSLVVDRAVCALPLLEAIAAAVRGGVDWIQIRERELEGAPLLRMTSEIARTMRDAAGARPTSLIVNRRIDIALAASADGAHLGFDALPLEDARRLLGGQAKLGISTHAVEEVADLAGAGADYVHLAPIFAPLSKPATRPALGLEALARASHHGVAVLAQGGIEAGRCSEVVRAGAAGVAVTGTILMSRDPEGAAAELRLALDRAAAAEPDDPAAGSPARGSGAT